MGPLYGDQLSFFPELLQPYTVFSMAPRIGAGYGRRTNNRTVTGYFSWIRGGTEGIQAELRTENQNATFWVRDDSGGKGLIRQGEYVEVDGELFQFIHDDGFSREGGFIVYNLQLVQGNTDQQQPHHRVNIGLQDYQ
jgi:hypothetical protein